ncbi:ribonuclease toxin immunity protein CdiI [Bacillus safensis]|uniref:ribonuclease toxin immunity protein CdiI n=1 Tax=Bacillus safensis TaxID=561879 RepID=UPI00203CBD97|nr:ribonuclease toxin immunity protein CdiI [Bacillus safensis]MCM3025303.1 ribonuclease toxin immunity protein CdiI [Bacillus safensis]
MLKKILETQMLRDEHFPVVAFFNAITDDSFVNVVQHLSTGVGYGINDVDCTFPNDLEPDEEPFHGVLFALHDDEVIVDYQTFYYYLEQACNTYITEYPQDKKTISEVLRKVFEKYRLAN